MQQKRLTSKAKEGIGEVQRARSLGQAYDELGKLAFEAPMTPVRSATTALNDLVGRIRKLRGEPNRPEGDVRR